jgi:hypothetical protein
VTLLIGTLYRVSTTPRESIEENRDGSDVVAELQVTFGDPDFTVPFEAMLNPGVNVRRGTHDKKLAKTTTHERQYL